MITTIDQLPNSFVRRYTPEGRELPSVSVVEAMANPHDETLSRCHHDGGVYLICEDPETGAVNHVEV